MTDATARLRRLRLALVLAAGLLLAGFVGTSGSTYHLRRGQLVAGLSGGSLVLGRAPMQRRLNEQLFAGAGLTLERSQWTSFRTAAWRPYRAASPGGPSRLIVPLWGPMVLAAGAAAMVHGMIVGRRRGRVTHDCPDCGYDLSHCPCPECGPGRSTRGTAHGASAA
ncbi:MAG: hypothetical protein AB8G96_00125 [Phycisphaerales bacterium]